MAQNNHDDDKNKLNEPAASYGEAHVKKIRIFHSFEEAAEADALQASQVAPLDHIRQTVELILRVYGVTREELKKRKLNTRIKIIRYE